MQEIPALITDLTIILVVAALTTLLCKKINLPSVLGYILAGFLAGPVVQFLPTIEDLGSIEVWSDIGVIFLMFGLGLEFSVHKMAEVGVPGFLSAGVQAVGMGAVGVLVGLALGWGTMNSVFLGVMLAMSSTMITMKSIEDLGLKKEPFANLAMGTLVIEDIIAIFAMVILSTIAVSQSISGFALAERIGLLLLYLALWLILGIYLVPTVMKKLVGLMNDEVLLVFSLGLCFLMAVLAEEIGLSTELGAFLAGSLLAGTVHAERVEHLVTPCKNLFGAVFFVSVGFMVQPAMIVQYILPILLLSVISIVGKLFFLTVGGLAAGKRLALSLPAAASQTQVGEFSFIIAGLGQSLSVTGAFLYPIIVAVSVLTTFTTPFLLKLSPPMERFLQAHLPKKWLDGIERWCQAREQTKEDEGRDWAKFLQGYFKSFTLYGILAMGAILVGVRALLPFLKDMLGGDRMLWAELIDCGAIYLPLAFLLPAMLHMKKRYFTSLWLDKVSNRVILSFLMVLRMAVAVLLAAVPAMVIFQVNPLWIMAGALPVIWMATHSKKLAGSYLEVEARFLANFNERKLSARFGQEAGQQAAHRWLTEQLDVVILQCPDDYALAGKRLLELDWGKHDHVNVIKILRGRLLMNIPEGHIVVQSGDKLVVMGGRQQIENFCRVQAQLGVTVFAEPITLKDYIANQQAIPEARQLLCCGVTLERSMPEAGKAVRDSGIKQDWSGILIGLERERKRRPAGFRTYMLVCLGAALTMLLSQYEYYMITNDWAALAGEIGIRTDVSRFGAQVINGIGFLGAGTIIVTGRQEVKGLTTAAGLWASACMGLAIGAGFYECVLLGFLLIFLAIRLLPYVENFIIENARNMNIYVEFQSLDDVGAIINRIKSQGAQIYEVDIERGREENLLRPSAVFTIRLRQKQAHTRVLAAISEVEGVYTIDEI